jgi:hypothetical protein
MTVKRIRSERNGFELLMMVSTKNVVRWIVAPCCLVLTNVSEVLAALMVEAAKTSETLINFYQTARRYNPADIHLQKRKSSYV